MSYPISGPAEAWKWLATEDSGDLGAASAGFASTPSAGGFVVTGLACHREQSRLRLRSGGCFVGAAHLFAIIPNMYRPRGYGKRALCHLWLWRKSGTIGLFFDSLSGLG